ncbi:hypothetical protein ERX27_07615 [Macrococcus brunensis]|uniref:Bro-N domain-containing protein n=1 Tax=Macrococcus brunensis TaxID=198483 RepID=A0A4R6BD09_9STAP|nr:BRO family protein [Macrococcus brunensis]TDL96714.1 hypothetical protein ERX27_07615 [Macrococcus brunensis]
MNQIQVISNQNILNNQFQIYGTFDEPLFLAKDVADWIEHSNPRMMINSVDEDEKQCVNNPYALKGQQEQWFLTEDGMYEVLMQSRKPIAKQFKKRVKAVLKEIRQTGQYIPKPLSTSQQIQLVAKGHTELDERITAIENDLLIRPGESKHIKSLVGQTVRETRKKYFNDHKEDWEIVNKKLFATVWSNFKRYFEIPNYQSLPLKKYDEAVSYLEKWQPGTDIIEDVKKAITRNQEAVM